MLPRAGLCPLVNLERKGRPLNSGPVTSSDVAQHHASVPTRLRMQEEPFGETTVSKELLLEFFLTFSRFEYALKATGYYKRRPVKPPDWPKAEPDWDRFAASLRKIFNSTAKDGLLQACAFFNDSPPNQQVLNSHGVAWETPVHPNNESEIEFLLRMVRCVRNNLFHGGKYNNDVHESKHRTEAFLRHALTILSACLKLAPQQAAAFREARM